MTLLQVLQLTIIAYLLTDTPPMHPIHTTCQCAMILIIACHSHENELIDTAFISASQSDIANLHMPNHYIFHSRRDKNMAAEYS